MRGKDGTCSEVIRRSDSVSVCVGVREVIRGNVNTCSEVIRRSESVSVSEGVRVIRIRT